MTQIDQKAIRDRAHAIWEREGRPNGRDRDHWLQAAWELAGENAKAPALAAKPASGRSAKGPKSPRPK